MLKAWVASSRKSSESAPARTISSTVEIRPISTMSFSVASGRTNRL